MAEDKVAKLELRIRQLEDQLKTFRAAEPQDLSADEVRAYAKVRGMLGGDVEFCGINDCQVCIVRCLRCLQCVSCVRCGLCTRCTPCVECVCGPCIAAGGGTTGLRRFSELGDE
jgi:hypothetical protein